LKALQVGHSLAGLQADQIIKLRALIAQQTVMFGEVFGRRQAIEDRQQATDQKYFELGTAASIDDGKEY
jgi:P-type conjugative transfer protein TrbJ